MTTINTIITNAKRAHSDTFAVNPEGDCPVCGKKHNLCLERAPGGTYFQECPTSEGYGLFDGTIEIVILEEEPGCPDCGLSEGHDPECSAVNFGWGWCAPPVEYVPRRSEKELLERKKLLERAVREAGSQADFYKACDELREFKEGVGYVSFYLLDVEDRALEMGVTDWEDFKF